jgi:hypothetical protein
MNLPQAFLSVLRDHGISMMEAFGTSDVALYANNAVAAAQALLGTRIAVLGGDVFYQTKTGFELAYANWHSEPEPSEDALAYAARSVKETCDYIRRFPERPDRTAVFSLVVAEVN